MKNLLTFPTIIFLTIITLLPQQSNAQYFAPIGAKWTYSYGLWASPPFSSPFTMEVIKDTTINGLSCRKVGISLGGSEYMYIKSVNDSVLVYSPVNNQFNLLYDFTSNVGDTLQIYFDNGAGIFTASAMDSTLVVIDSVSIKNINGINYRAYFQRLLPSSSVENIEGWVIDSLGVMNYNGGEISYLFPYRNMGGPPMSFPLRCYIDSNTYYNYNNINCDTIITRIGMIKQSNFKIYPTIFNREDGKISIETNNLSTPKQIKLFSLAGISIPIKIETHEVKTELILNKNIPSGVYLLRFDLDKEVFTRKILIL